MELKFSWWSSFAKIWIIVFTVISGPDVPSDEEDKKNDYIESESEHADQIINFQTILRPCMYESWVKSRPSSRKETFIEESYLAAFVSLSVIISSSGFQYL